MKVRKFVSEFFLAIAILIFGSGFSEVVVDLVVGIL